MHSFAKEMTHFIKTLKGLAFVIYASWKVEKRDFHFDLIYKTIKKL